jgi:agmatine deiminase
MSSPDLPTGWRMPAEWSPHEATWLAWPHHRADWPGKFTPIPWVYAEILRHLTRSERVHLLVNDAAAETKVRRFLSRVDVDLAQIQFFRRPTDRVWTRDFGPIFVTSSNGEVGYTHWRFNGWAKYDNWKLDTQVPTKLKLPMPSWTPHHQGRRVVLEGGSIDVNGDGLLLTTEECLLSPVQERNPGFGRDDYEAIFRDYLGIKKTLWLGRGIAGDDTHGHVDDLARFVGPRTVVVAQEPNEADENHVPLRENLERLRGYKLEAVPLPMPSPVVCDGQRLPASYANFYIANRHVLVPTFNDPNDCVALGVLRELFPGRTVVGIHAVDLVFGLGTLHCMTQQQPQAGDESSSPRVKPR